MDLVADCGQKILLPFPSPVCQIENIVSANFWDNEQTHIQKKKKHLLFSSLALNAVYIALKPS